MALQQERLQLDPEQSSPAFQSWRLSKGSEASQQTQSICGKLCVATEGSYDYLHTRTSLLKNHLRSHFKGGTIKGSALHMFQRDRNNDLSFSKVQAFWVSHAVMGSRLQQHADINQPHGAHPPLDCSAAHVQQHTLGKDSSFLVSSGHGDMDLVGCGNHASHNRARSGYTPLQLTKLGGRPFCIEGAWQASPGVLRAVVWTLEPKSATQAAACCIYAVTLHVADDLSLTEEDAHLLIKAKLPPHAVIVSAELDAVALAVDPMRAESSPANPGASVAPGPVIDAAGEDDDVPSPRTLRAAAERLAQYTSEQPDAGPTTQGQGFADIYSEVSPDDEGLSSEPECEIYCYSWWRQAPAPDTPSRQEAGSAGLPEAAQPEQAAQPPGRAPEGPPRLTAQISCSPHGVLTGQGPGLDRSSALLGLIDDVDCAVVSLAFTKDPASPVQLQHVATVPALAYVATGKTQRKYTLLGKPGSGIAAVIVEANRFAYVYHETPPNQPHGKHQVLDLDLPEDATVLGAVLDTRLTGGPRTFLQPSLHILLHDCLRNFKIDPYPTGG